MRKNILCLTILFTIFLTIAIPMTFATNGDLQEPLADLFADFAKILPVTVMVGLTTSMLGYMRKTPPEEFELYKFLATCVIGLMIGVITLEVGWDYTTAQEYLANSGLTIYIYWLCKIIAKKAGWISNSEVVAPNKPSP